MENLELKSENGELLGNFAEDIKSGALEQRKYLKMGITPGKDIKILKQFLASKNLYPKNKPLADFINDTFDEDTKVYLWMYQSSKEETKPDGIFGPNTLKSILKELEKKSVPVKTQPEVIQETKVATAQLKEEHIVVEKTKVQSTQLSQEVKEIPKKKITTDKEAWDEYLSLSKEEKLKKYTYKTDNGYLCIDFGNKYIERHATIDDIIPDEYLHIELVKNQELKKFSGNREPNKDDYFNIISREPSGKFQSVFSGNIYKRPVIYSGYLIKLGEKNQALTINQDLYTFTQDEDETGKIIGKDEQNNELAIKNLYGVLIKETIAYWKTNLNDIGKEILDEALVYSIIRQESRFDPNALSSTFTRALMQITLSTGGSLIQQNTKEKQEEQNTYKVSFDDLMPVDRKKAFYDGTSLKNVKTRMYNPEHSLKIGIQYLAQLIQKFSYPGMDKAFIQKLVIASYNAGETIILTAWNMGKPKNKDELVHNLEILGKNGEMSLNKLEEIKGYLEEVGKNHQNVENAIKNGYIIA